MPCAAKASEIDYRAQLTGTAADPLATGRAIWRLNTETGQRQLDIRVENVSSTSLAMAFVGGRFVGYLIIVNGSASLSLDSFAGDAVPRVTAGSAAEVRRVADGVIILSGTFTGG
jgi:hypothetical protein